MPVPTQLGALQHQKMGHTLIPFIFSDRGIPDVSSQTGKEVEKLHSGTSQLSPHSGPSLGRRGEEKETGQELG